MKIDEDNEFYLSALIRLYHKLDREVDALSYQRRLVNSRSEIPSYWIDLIQLLYAQEEYAEALELTNDALTRCGTYVEFYYLQSMLLWKTGKQKKA